MSVTNFVPEVWETQLLLAFRKAHKFGALVNRNYEGNIRNAGDTVRITTPAAITVGNYAGTVVYQTPTSTQQSLVIDQDIYWAFTLDDVEQVQANVNLMQAYMQESAYAMADNVDQNIANLYTAAGAGNVTIDLTASTVDFYGSFVEAGKNLDIQNVPREGRWAVISPVGYAALLEDTKFTSASDLGDAVVQSGAVGRVAGFTVYVSNNLAVPNTRRYLYGTNAAITFASQLVKTEALRAETGFDDLVRGRMVFGRRVVRPAALGTFVATEV
jgi:hypothetical protein